MQKWRAYVGYDVYPLSDAHPGAIDNADLLDELDGKIDEGDDIPHLRDDVVLERDYTLICMDAWRLLQKTYTGGPVIQFPVVNDGSSLRVETCQLHFTYG